MHWRSVLAWERAVTGGSKAVRAGLYVGCALAAAWFGATVALAQTEPGEINLHDPSASLAGPPAPQVTVSSRTDGSQRFEMANPGVRRGEAQGPRRLELSVAAGGGDSPVDVSIAQRASIGSNAEGEI